MHYFVFTICASAAVCQHREFQKTTDITIDAVIREWLRTAGDRDGGRKERYRRSESQSSTAASDVEGCSPN